MLVGRLGTAGGLGHMGGDEIEIDLTADVPDGTLPIRWVGPAVGASLANGSATAHGNGNGNGSVVSTAPAVAPVLPVPRIVTLASFIPPASPARTPEPPTITLVDANDWYDPYDLAEPVTLRTVMASRGARFLAVVVSVILVAVVAGTVLLWDRVEAPRRPAASVQLPPDAVTHAELVELQSRLNGLETKLATIVDTSGTATDGPVAAELAFQLAVLRSCVAQFQHAIDVGAVRGGQFPYCG